MMKVRNIYLGLLAIFVIQSCGNKTSSEGKKACPLQAPYEYFDQINNSEFHLSDLESKLSKAKGRNNTDEINKILGEFEVSHKECIKKLDEKFPVGSIKIPFEQTGNKDTVVVKAIYVSAFEFPWNTASSICYSFTIEYDLLKPDIWYAKIPLTFFDSEGDIINICNVEANTSGKTQFPVKAQESFRIFSKITIK
jgi:hypothetical protein